MNGGPITCPTSTNWVNPLNFGAVGNGVHDDTAAIASANNAGDVCFPSGKTYLVSVGGGHPIFSIGGANRHWQAGMIGGPAPVLKEASIPSGCSTADECDIVGVSGIGYSVIGMDFEGPVGEYPTYNEWHMAIRAYPNANDGLVAGNTFNNFAGDGNVELVGDFSTAGTTITGWRVAYSSAAHCGNYSYVVVAGQNNTFDHNTSAECSEGVENDNATQVTGGNLIDHETMTNSLGSGYCRSALGRSSGCTCLTGGLPYFGGANYSGNTVSNSAVSGSASCIAEGGAGAANYTNDTCTSGCQVQ